MTANNAASALARGTQGAARLTLGMYEPARGSKSETQHRRDARAETRAMKATARRWGKPLGYTWPLWFEAPTPGGRGVPVAHLRRTASPLAWVNNALAPAWRRMYAAEQRRKGNVGTWTDDES